MVGLAVFLRQGSLKAGADQTSLPIRLLMGFSGLSLLLQAIFQFPLIPGNTDLSSWQRVIGFHKTDERADDLVIAAFAFLLSMAILRVVRSHTYVAYTVKLLDYETTVLARERRRVTAQLARQELIAHQGEMEAEKARCREQKTKLLRKLSGENEMKDKRVSRTEPDATVPPRDHPSTSVSSKQEEQSILTKEILTTAPEGDSPMSKRLLHWLIDNSDPVLAIGAGAQPDGLHMPTHSSRLHKEVRLLSKFKAAVKLVGQAVKATGPHAKPSIVAAPAASTSLLIFRAAIAATFNRSLEICCLSLSLNFIMHVDIVSSLFPLSLFGICLLNERLIGVKYWKAAIVAITVRLVVVKFLNAWDTEDLQVVLPEYFSFFLNVDPTGQIWDLVALTGLIMHRHHLRLRGDWQDDGNLCDFFKMESSAMELFRNSRRPSSFGPGEFHHRNKIGHDYYPWIILTQVICIALSPFLYSIITGDEVTSISQQVNTNAVSWLLVFLFFMQFCSFLIEFGIYLTKSIFAKAILQWLNLSIYVSLYMYWSTQAQVQQSPVLQLFFFTMCIGFYVSAAQINEGYPDYRPENRPEPKFPTSSLRSSYRALPFLIELQYLVEWFCTPTTLSLYNYIRVEQLYNLMYMGKVSLTAAKKIEEANTVGWIPVRLEYCADEIDQHCVVQDYDDADETDVVPELPKAITVKCHRDVELMEVEELINDAIAEFFDVTVAVDHISRNGARLVSFVGVPDSRDETNRQSVLSASIVRLEPPFATKLKMGGLYPPRCSLTRSCHVSSFFPF